MSSLWTGWIHASVFFLWSHSHWPILQNHVGTTTEPSDHGGSDDPRAPSSRKRRQWTTYQLLSNTRWNYILYYTWRWVLFSISTGVYACDTCSSFSCDLVGLGAIKQHCHHAQMRGFIFCNHSKSCSISLQVETFWCVCTLMCVHNVRSLLPSPLGYSIKTDHTLLLISMCCHVETVKPKPKMCIKTQVEFMKYCLHVFMCKVHYSWHNWRAGASQPSRDNGTIFLYIYICCMWLALYIL